MRIIEAFSTEDEIRMPQFMAGAFVGSTMDENGTPFVESIVAARMKANVTLRFRQLACKL